MTEIITIKKYEASKKDGGKFDAYKINQSGKAVDLSFRQDSNNLKTIPYGVVRVKVEKLEPSKNSFYPKFYATFIELVKNDTDLK